MRTFAGVYYGRKDYDLARKTEVLPNRKKETSYEKSIEKEVNSR